MTCTILHISPETILRAAKVLSRKVIPQDGPDTEVFSWPKQFFRVYNPSNSCR